MCIIFKLGNVTKLKELISKTIVNKHVATNM